MNIIFGPVTLQYTIAFDHIEIPAISLENIKLIQFPSDQTLRTEYYFSSTSRGHSHPIGNVCRYCGGYFGARSASGGARHCPYSEF